MRRRAAASFERYARHVAIMRDAAMLFSITARGLAFIESWVRPPSISTDAIRSRYGDGKNGDSHSDMLNDLADFEPAAHDRERRHERQSAQLLSLLTLLTGTHRALPSKGNRIRLRGHTISGTGRNRKPDFPGDQRRKGWCRRSESGRTGRVLFAVRSPSWSFCEEVERTEPPLLLPIPRPGPRVRMLAQMIGCEIHPVQQSAPSEGAWRSSARRPGAEIADWFSALVNGKPSALEKILEESCRYRQFCHGDSPGMADICSSPQVAIHNRALPRRQ